MALHNEYATSHLNNGEENQSKWYLSSGTPSQVPISTKQQKREQKIKERTKKKVSTSKFPQSSGVYSQGVFQHSGLP